MIQKKGAGSSPSVSALSCCRVESLISIDERGQMVLPKDLREKADIKAGDKLAVISMEREGKISCISLIKADDFADMVKEFLGPMMRDVAADDGGGT